LNFLLFLVETWPSNSTLAVESAVNLTSFHFNGVDAIEGWWVPKYVSYAEYIQTSQ